MAAFVFICPFKFSSLVKIKLFLVLAIALIAGIILFLMNRTGGGPDVLKPIDNKPIKVISGLETCQICGYDALDSIGSVCKNCQYSLSKQAAEREGLANVQNLLALRQTEYFIPDSLGQPIDFLKPEVTDEGYPKNPKWRPVVFESDIYEFQKALIMFEAYGDSVKTNNELPVESLESH